MQDKSKIRLEIDYLEHQRDYFDAEVTDKLKELNELLNMEKTQVTAEWLKEKGFYQKQDEPSYRWFYDDGNFMYDIDDFTIAYKGIWDFPKKQYCNEIEIFIHVVSGKNINLKPIFSKIGLALKWLKSFLKRLLFYPFVLCILLIKSFLDSLKLLMYGGEMYLYNKDDKKLISDIYRELKKQRNVKSTKGE